ncbi:hypothetical protein L6452_21865 [Arctium lappa]|uniref:Uncharacterized protein n=1 Tax=Arctium lappa TaxID=4217 RepID=A0ACB9AZW9_ARCLA|nr:hypothetical protein L6452_21865 [Arctium lappa]
MDLGLYLYLLQNNPLLMQYVLDLEILNTDGDLLLEFSADEGIGNEDFTRGLEILVGIAKRGQGDVGCGWDDDDVGAEVDVSVEVLGVDCGTEVSVDGEDVGVWFKGAINDGE